MTAPAPVARPGRVPFVDEVAVERAVCGPACWVPEHLTAAERREAVRRLVRVGWSSQHIADRLRVSTRTVDRDCKALGLDRGRGREFRPHDPVGGWAA